MSCYSNLHNYDTKGRVQRIVNPQPAFSMPNIFTCIPPNRYPVSARPYCRSKYYC